MWHIAMALLVLTLGSSLGAETAVTPPAKPLMLDGGVDAIGRISMLKGKPTDEEVKKAFPTDYTNENYEAVELAVEKHLEYLEQKYGTTYWDDK